MSKIGTWDEPPKVTAATSTASTSADEIGISPIILIRGAGEMASAIAWRLHRANIRRICMTELNRPLCVRRTVSFCTALENGDSAVEGVQARAVANRGDVLRAWQDGTIAVIAQSQWAAIAELIPDVVIDAILAKRNIATDIDDAQLVIALGPGFTVGRDCHLIIETNRGHHLGRIIEQGVAEANTGIPGDIAGHTRDRVLRSTMAGLFQTERCIGEAVRQGEAIGQVADVPVIAAIDGILRGLLASGTLVSAGLKLGDIDPRARQDYCNTISDKARAIAGAALECVMRHYNRPTLSYRRI